jgi:hypothetical protein
MMRIVVSAAATPLTGDQRAYAEYRVFTAVAAYGARITSVDVVVAPDAAPSARYRCSIAVDLGRRGCVNTQARSGCALAAIDRAADRAGRLVARRFADDCRSKSGAFIS